jgi:FkbM family methyltransferase
MLVEMISWSLHRLPFKSGLTRLSFNPFMNRLMKSYKDPTTAILRDGNEIVVDPSDYHGRVLYLFGTNDVKVEMNATAFLRPGDVFLDIGANYSTIGLAASHVVGPTGVVHLFEPQKRIADRVETAIRLGGYTNVRLHRVGLLDEDATLEIKGPGGHSGRATFIDHEDATDFTIIERCPVREVSGYVGPLVAGRPFGVKIDIEGAEPKVLPWLLAQPNLRFVIFEAAHNQQLLYEQIRTAAVTLYGLDRSALRLTISRVDNFSEMTKYHDLIGLKLTTSASPSTRIDPRRLALHL